MKQANLGDVFRKSSKSACTSFVVSPYPLSLTPSSASTMKTPGNTEDDPGDPESGDAGDIQSQYSSD